MKPNFNLDFSNMRPGQISSGPMSISQQPVQQPGVALPPPSQPVTFPPPELPPIVPAKRPAEEEDRPAPPQSHKIVYAELDRDAPLIDQLKGVHVIEWPVIDVYLDAQQPTSNTLEIELKPIAAAHKSDAPPVLKATKLEASEEKGLGLDAYGSDSETEEQAQEEVVDLLVPR